MFVLRVLVVGVARDGRAAPDHRAAREPEPAAALLHALDHRGSPTSCAAGGGRMRARRDRGRRSGSAPRSAPSAAATRWDRLKLRAAGGRPRGPPARDLALHAHARRRCSPAGSRSCARSTSRKHVANNTVLGAAIDAARDEHHRGRQRGGAAARERGVPADGDPHDRGRRAQRRARGDARQGRRHLRRAGRDARSRASRRCSSRS